MRKLHSVLIAAGVAAMLGGAAVAASLNTHLMTVPLPDGSVARIEYVGDVPPRVTIAPGAEPRMGAFVGPATTPFGMFDHWAVDLRRQFEAMSRQMNDLDPRSAGGIGPGLAAYGSMPAGSSSVTVISTSNGKDSCTRTTQVTSVGPGKPPKVVSNVSGKCSAAPGAAAKPESSAQPIGAGAISRT